MTDPHPPEPNEVPPSTANEPPAAGPEPFASPRIPPASESLVREAPREIPPNAVPADAVPADTVPAGDAPVRARPSRTAMPVLSALGFLLLLAGLAWLYTQQQDMKQALSEQATRIDAAPAVGPAQVASLTKRLAALEQRVDALASKPPADTGDLSALESRVAALEARKPPPPADTAGAMAPLTQKLDSVASEAAAAKSAEAATASQLADLAARLKQAEQQEATLAGRTTLAQRVAQAQAALDAGEPVGTIPDAPPALARFAQTKPPTEAALRLSFPAAADAAEDASRPSVEGKSLGERMWLRARSLVTVKRGDTVLVGAPAATVLAAAHARLQAGDLAGALKELDRLDGPAARAMAEWRAQAQQLLDARAALVQMARA